MAHGKEFSGYQDIEGRLSLAVYFCHPYSPWKRGTNEYFHRHLRWFLPKQTSFAEITQDQIIETIELINGHPIKVLNRRAATDCFREFFDKCSD